MWNDVGELRNLSSWLQWISISLVFFSGFLQVGKYAVDRREREVSTIEQANLSKPARQLIRTGSATIEVTTNSSDQTNSHFMDSGAYMAFGRAGEAMLVMRSLDCFGVQNGKGEVVWRAVLSLDANDPSVGKEIRFLQGAGLLELGFSPMPAKAQIKRGLVIVTLNSAVRLEIPIPAQVLEEKRIAIPDLTVIKGQLE
jgi:hypothetical protein